MKRYRRLQWILLTGTITAVGLVMTLIMFSHRQPVLGPVDGRLRPCPASPNCVCSTDIDDGHVITPLDAHEDPQATMDRLRRWLGSQKGVQLVSDEEAYIHAEFTTPLLRFVDDVEFLLDPVNGVIHVRSASRVGWSDFGVNRRRVEMIRQILSGKESQTPDR